MVYLYTKQNSKKNTKEKIKAQDDFYGYVNQETLQKLDIPFGESSNGTFTETEKIVEEQLDEIIEQVMSSESEEVEKTINSELEKIDSLKNAVEDKIQEIINEHPEVTNVAKKISNARFTNFWNGIEY